MAFNGSGQFNRVHNWATDKTNSTPVTASRMDTEDDGFATGLSSCLVKDGQQTATARIPFTLGVSAMAGSVSSVSYSQTNDNNTGLYFPATDEVALAAGGTRVLHATSSVISVPSGVTLKSNTTPYDAFPAGTVCVFGQTSAPTGWTKATDASVHDRALRVTTGTAGTGGSVAFSTLFARTGTDAFTISQANLPNVSFTHSGTTLTNGTGSNIAVVNGVGNITVRAGGSGTGGGFALGVSQDSGTEVSLVQTASNVSVNAQGSAASGGSGTAITPAIDLRVKYFDVILATKD